MGLSIKDQVIQKLAQMTETDQKEMLDLANKLLQPKGVPGKSLMRFVGAIDPEDLQVMAQAIEEDCERIDPHD